MSSENRVTTAGDTKTRDRPRSHGDGSDREPDSIQVLHEEPDAAHRDRIRWGPIWSGIVVALGTFILLQLALVALGLFDVENPQTADAVWSAAAGGLAFLLGGVTTGATALWRGVDDGLLHGIVLWAVALVVLVALSSLGSGIALGAVDTTEVFDGVTQADVEEVLADDAQEVAGQALLALTVALIAAAVGGLLGAKLWPRVDELVLDRGSTDRRHAAAGERPGATSGAGGAARTTGDAGAAPPR